MNTFQFAPEGWNEKIEKLDIEKVYEYKNENKILQGIVDSCDKDYNLHINLGNKLEGIIPRNEVENLENEIPSEKLCIGKVNKYVQFKIKNVEENGRVVLSRKSVQEDAIKYVKDNVKKFSSGMTVPGIIRETEKNKNGIFIELTPNLVGMAEYTEGYTYGQKVNVYIKKIDNERKKVKLMIEAKNI